jgi:hypothetical protein
MKYGLELQNQTKEGGNIGRYGCKPSDHEIDTAL